MYYTSFKLYLNKSNNKYCLDTKKRYNIVYLLMADGAGAAPT